MKLTDKQKAFCEEYIKDFNATQSAIRAGYSEKTANRISSENLSKLDIQTYIQELQQKATKRNDITVDRVLQELASIAFLDIAEFYTEGGILKRPHEIEETARRAIASISTKEEKFKMGDIEEVYDIKTIKSADKLKALELLGKYLAMFTEKVEVSGELKVIDPFKEENE